MILKKIFIWVVIFFISIALIITGFTINPRKYENEENYIKISNKLINNSDIKNIITYKKSKNKFLSKINDIDALLKNLIIENIKINIHKEKIINVTKIELLETLLNLDEFKENDIFSIKNYKKFLNDNQLTEFEFQNKLLKILKKSQLNKSLKIIKSNYNKKINNYYKEIIKEKNLNALLKDIHNLKKNKLNNLFFPTKNLIYIDLSIKENIKYVKTVFYSSKKDKNHIKLILFKCYKIEKNKIKKKYIITHHNETKNNIYIELNKKPYLIKNNLILINSNKCIEINFNKIKAEIINLDFKKKSINNILNFKTYIIKNLNKKNFNNKLLSRNKKYIYVNTYSSKFINLKTLSKNNIKENDYFIFDINKDNSIKNKLIWFDMFKIDIINKKTVTSNIIKKENKIKNKLLILNLNN